MHVSKIKTTKLKNMLIFLPSLLFIISQQVLDGHNGNAAAIYTRDNLLNHMLSAVPRGLSGDEWLHALPRALVAGFVKTDKEFQTKGKIKFICLRTHIYEPMHKNLNNGLTFQYNNKAFNSLIPIKLGYVRNEVQSKSIEISDLKCKKIIVIVAMTLIIMMMRIMRMIIMMII
jgi:hypothetical protein